MTIRANQLTLLHLFFNQSLTLKAVYHLANTGHLLRTRKVVEMHCCMVKSTVAVCARHPTFNFDNPITKRLTLFALSETTRLSSTFERSALCRSLFLRVFVRHHFLQWVLLTLPVSHPILFIALSRVELELSPYEGAALPLDYSAKNPCTRDMSPPL